MLTDSSSHTRECLSELFTSQIGVRETKGSNSGIRVDGYLKSVGLSPGYPWCAAFVSWCFQNAEVSAPISAWVPSYALTSKRIYERGTALRGNPQKGDVFLIWYKSKNRAAHIGFIEEWGENTLITVEGNTNASGAREGDGVYRKRRLTRQVWAVSDFIDL